MPFATQSPLVVALFLSIGKTAIAEEWAVRDRSGRTVETIEEGYGDTLIRRDHSGRRIGTIEPGLGDGHVLRDRDGRRTGTVEQGLGDDLVVRDRSGRRTHTLDRTYGNHHDIRDPSGRRVGTIERRRKSGRRSADSPLEGEGMRRHNGGLLYSASSISGQDPVSTRNIH